MESKKRVQVIYKGRVQGVGFRYNADNIAHHFEVTGYVKNLPNGDVEMVVEGEEIVIRDFLQAIRDSRMKEMIREEKIEWMEPNNYYQHFGIAL